MMVRLSGKKPGTISTWRSLNFASPPRSSRICKVLSCNELTCSPYWNSPTEMFGLLSLARDRAPSPLSVPIDCYMRRSAEAEPLLAPAPTVSLTAMLAGHADRAKVLLCRPFSKLRIIRRNPSLRRPFRRSRMSRSGNLSAGPARKSAKSSSR